jgi:uncharacterized membrane protein HdeD (DUF308 family)
VTHLGYFLGALMMVMGGLLLAGYFQIRNDADEGAVMLRTVFGIVLVLYGIYRIVSTRQTLQQRERMQGRGESE